LEKESSSHLIDINSDQTRKTLATASIKNDLINNDSNNKNKLFNNKLKNTDSLNINIGVITDVHID